MEATAKEFFTSSQKEQLIQAIRQAELQTSGEIKVHVEQRCPQADVMVRAKEVFVLLNLTQTKLKNGVLFYLSIDDRKFAILGDEGIDRLVPATFWQNAKDTMRSFFKQGDLVEGLSQGIRMAGEQLSTNFPPSQDDTNELTDELSLG